MRIEDYDFELTAKAVYAMNESMREQYANWREVESFMMSMAYQHGDSVTSFSTGGFQLTFFKGSDGETICRASVSAYTAERYASAVNDRLNHIASLAKA